MNAMLSDRLALAQRRRFGSSSEKYADGYEQPNLFNEAEAADDVESVPENEIEVGNNTTINKKNLADVFLLQIISELRTLRKIISGGAGNGQH